MNVLIITRSNDNACIPTVASAVEARGGRAFRLDTDRFPTELRLGARHGGGLSGRYVQVDGERLDLDEVTGVWHRRLDVAGRLPKDMDPQIRGAAVQESRRALLGGLTSLEAFVMDPLANIRRTENKEMQLRLAERLGLETPRTLVTNDPATVRAFAEECGGDVVTKMQSSFAIHADGREFQMLGEWRAFDLPADVERRVLQMQDALGLNYGAIDFILTPDERLVFLEINPSEFFWLERVPGFPLSEAIADVLLERAPRRDSRRFELAG